MAIRCELCGSTDIVKEGDIFVCRGCGAKYSPEAAKKLIDGVPPAPNPGVPNASAAEAEKPAQLENWRMLARSSRMEGNAANAAKYYGLVLENEPENWEARFYQTYFRAKETNLAGIPGATESVLMSQLFTHGLIAKADMTDEEKFAAFKDVADSSIAFSQNIFNIADNYRSQNSGNAYAADSANSWIVSAMKLFEATCILAESKGNTDYHSAPECKAYALSLRKKYNEALAEYGYALKSDIRREKMEENTNIIKASDANYIQPERESAGGCYIATCVYGSYDCPEVWTLRRFRDFKLAKTFPGRAFIRGYYAISPALVRRFGKTGLFRRFFRGFLDRMVSRLKTRGFADTPYADKKY